MRCRWYPTPPRPVTQTARAETRRSSEKHTAPHPLSKNYLLEHAQKAGVLGGLGLENFRKLYFQNNLWPWETKNVTQDPAVRVMIPPEGACPPPQNPFPPVLSHQIRDSVPRNLPPTSMSTLQPSPVACELLRRARRRKRGIKDPIVATSLLQWQKGSGNSHSTRALSTGVGGTKRPSNWIFQFY